MNKVKVDNRILWMEAVAQTKDTKGAQEFYDRIIERLRKNEVLSKRAA